MAVGTSVKAAVRVVKWMVVGTSVKAAVRVVKWMVVGRAADWVAIRVFGFGC